ncbi:MAG: hypothetical protein ABI823_01540 [Bryobacteraceae bacterium]
MAVSARSLHLDDAAVLEAFENCTLPAESFAHADHIRLARLYVRQLGAAAAADALAIAIRRFAEAHGADKKYHETVTRAWAALVAGAPGATFEEFRAANPDLFDKDALSRYYSPELLTSPLARREFLPPDRNPLP